MSGLDDEGGGGGPSSPQIVSPPRLVNLSVADESLTSTLDRSLHREDADKVTPPTTPESFSGSDAKGGDGVDDSRDDGPHGDPNNPTQMASDNFNYSQHSNPYADSASYGSNPYADSTATPSVGGGGSGGGGKTMEVTVTVLSLHGMTARRSAKKKKKEEKKRMKRIRKGGLTSAEIDKPKATIVASFSQNIANATDRVFLTHVPSKPVSLTPDADASGADGEVLRPVVHWSSMDADDEEAGKALSTLRFKRKFVRENNPNAVPGGASRYLPQTCPINLSVSRNGRMALLGKVDLLINGEERGKGSVTAPIASSIRPSKSKMGKKIRKMGKSSKDAGGEDEAIPMVRIKGDAYQFGLGGLAMLRMLVHVHDPDAILEEGSFGVGEEAYGDAGYGGDAYGDDGAPYGADAGGAYGAYDSTSDHERGDDSSGSDNDDEDDCLLSVEGDDPSILGGDDYFHHRLSCDELGILRQQLAKSEQTNNVLQMELANAQHSVDQLHQVTVRQKAEYDDLVRKLHLAMQNANTLLHDVKAAKADSEMLPIYEGRVTELLEELRRRDGEVEELTEGIEKRDLEISCLREEIDTLNGRYKRELADSLLWDDGDDGGANLGGKSDGVGGVDAKAEEKKARDDPLGKWGMRKLGIGLNVVPEEKGDDVDEDDEEEADEEEAEAKKGEAPQDGVPEKPPSEKRIEASLEASAGEGMVDPVQNDKGVEEGESPGGVWPREEAEGDQAAPLGGESPKDSGGERARDNLAVALEAAATVSKDKGEDDKSSKKEASGGRGWGVRLLVGRSSPTAEEESANVDARDARAVNDAATKEGREGSSHSSAGSVSGGSSNDDEADASPMRQGRGWGLRGIGASLLSVEERMRERQQLFLEQQLSEAAAKKAREDAAAAAPASVLISRPSPAWPSGRKTLAEESAEESAEETDDELAEIEKPGHGEEEDKESSEEAMLPDQRGDAIGSEEELKVVITAGEEVGEVTAKEEVCESEQDDEDKEACCTDGTGKLQPDTFRDDNDFTTVPDFDGDTPPKEDAAGDDNAESTKVMGPLGSSDGAGGEAPITSPILGAASSSWDGDASAAVADGDAKNTSGGISADVGGDAAPFKAQGEKKGDDPADENASNAIVSAASDEAEAEVDKVPDIPSANDDNSSQAIKDLKGSEEQPQRTQSKAKGPNADAPLEEQQESAAEVLVTGDAPSPAPVLRMWGEEKDLPAPAESPPSEEVQVDSPKKQKRGWGVRGIGARLKGVEGKMKERQRMFREQQQRELEMAEKEKAMTAAQPGLGGALISGFSSHSGTKAATLASDGSGERVDETQAEEPAASLSGDAGEDAEQDDVLTEEAREHRRASNQALLLESMDKLEEDLLSGISGYDDEKGKDEGGLSVSTDSNDKSLTATSRNTNSNDEDASSTVPSDLAPLSIRATVEDCGHASPGESAGKIKQQADKAINDDDGPAKDTPFVETEEGPGENCKEIAEEKVAAPPVPKEPDTVPTV